MRSHRDARGHANGRLDLTAVLRQTALLGGLDEAHLTEVVSRAGHRRFGADEALFQEGDRARGLHIVIEGRIKVFKTSPKGREQTLDPCETIYIPRQAFLDLIGREPEVAMRLLSALSARLRSFASLIEDLSLRDVSERLAAYLLSLATEGTPEETFDLRVSKSELSAAVGTVVGAVPETLSRAFGQLARAGAVQTRGRRVHIKDRALLARVARVRP